MGVLERWYAVQPVPRVCAVILGWEQPCSEQALRAALSRVSQRHHARLQVTLAGSTRAPLFAPIAKGPGDGAPYTRLTTDVWPVCGDWLAYPFEPGAALWQAAHSADGRQLLLVFHHAVADGHAAVTVADEVARALAHALDEAPPPTPPQPVERLVDTRLTLSALREVWQSHREGRASWFYGSSDGCGPLTTTVVRRKLGTAELAALRCRAREQGCTVHCALSVAALWACARLDGGGHPLRLTSPISLRQRAKPAPTGMGVYIGALTSDHRLSPNERFWALARAYRGRLGAAPAHAAAMLGLLARAGDLQELALRSARMAPNARTASVEVSNLGLRRLHESVSQLWFTQGNHYHGPLLNLSVVSASSEGSMALCLAIPSPLLSDVQADAYMDHLMRILEGARQEPGLRMADI